ncbi:MAG: hypothetical protein JO180_00645, partial [Gemmatirosa sp.]|nr:hypothetical protein [Gemmatirosa sp.]
MTTSPRRIRLLVVAAAALAFAGGTRLTAQPRDAAYYAFRSSVDTGRPRPGVPVFRLSRDYPARLPGPCAECTWYQVGVDFSTNFP